MRVYQIAKALGTDSRFVMDDLRARGFQIRSASTPIMTCYAQAYIATRFREGS